MAIASHGLGGLILGQVSPILLLCLKHRRAIEHTWLPQQYITMGMEDARPCCDSALTDGISLRDDYLVRLLILHNMI